MTVSEPGPEDTPVSEAGTILGDCPRCGTTIPGHKVLITYRKAGGWPATYAECPACEVPVHPR